MALIEQGSAKIVSINKNGLGVAASNQGKKLAIPYSLPSEEVKYELHKCKRKETATFIELVKPSPERQEASCQFFSQCGGCLLQHMSEKQYSEFKISAITQPLIDCNIETNILDTISIGPGKRRRANFEFFHHPENPVMGFHKYHFNKLVDLTECPSVEKIISDLMKPLKEMLLKLTPIKQRVQIYITSAANGIDILMRLNKEQAFEADHHLIIDNFFKTHGIIRLKVSQKKKILYKQESEEPYVVFSGKKIGIDSDCFLQSTKESDKILANQVLKILEPNNNDNIIDLFCGRGTYTIPISEHSKISAYECDSKALNALEKISLKHKLPITISQRDLYKTPIFSDELKKFNKVIINPPRAGAKSQCIEIAACNFEKIAYVSCNPESFAQDAKILIDAGYILSDIQPVDQFHWNPHIEIVASFYK